MQSKSFLHNSVQEAVHDYFSDLEGTEASGLYNLVLSSVEAPLLETVMKYAEGNQSLAARWLGINRLTLRKLLSKYNLS